MKNIWVFTIFVSLVFLLWSTFIAYELIGDFSFFYYRELKFVFLKVLGAFYRGTTDNIDYDVKMSTHNNDPFLK
jgi:hypothetical protein